MVVTEQGPVLRLEGTGLRLQVDGLLSASTTIAGTQISANGVADMILIVCYLAATALVAVSIVVVRLQERDQPERARRFDRWARWSLPVVAALSLAVSALVLWN